MKNIHTFTSAFICFILAVIFHNCAPLAESGSFQNPSISVSNSKTPKNSTNGDGSATDNGEADSDGGTDGDGETDGDGGTDGDGETDGDGGNDEDNKTPKGPEFTGTESEETGQAPITRGLY
ncbi:MAG: hypothetical protein OXM55_05200 [Bdellovibrionales bacterium]|nr:hypothetical protein [Bdellovibrionales bacterium]